MTPVEQVGGLVQLMNGVHVECQKGDFSEALRKLRMAQTEMERLGHEIWLQTRRSGEGNA
jgi:hypothetical protein